MSDNTFDPQHPHEPEIPPHFDADGRCLICVMICERDNAIRERDEAQGTLTDIHRWIERNHPDGFIDSMTFHQNLERVGDRWYDCLDIVERERDEARKQNAKLQDIAERLYQLAMKNDVKWSFEEDGDSLSKIRAELDQLKEGGK